MSPYADALKELAGESSGGFANPFTASSDANRLKMMVEKRLRESNERYDPKKIKADGYSEGWEAGKKVGEETGRDTMRVECLARLSRIAQTEIDVRREDAFDKTFAAVEQRISTLEKEHGDEAARPRRLMRDIATKLGVSVNDKMGLNDLHNRIVGAIGTETNVPNLMPEDEIKAALKETTWKKEFGDYHEFVRQLNGKRIIIVPASR